MYIGVFILVFLNNFLERAIPHEHNMFFLINAGENAQEQFNTSSPAKCTLVNKQYLVIPNVESLFQYITWLINIILPVWNVFYDADFLEGIISPVPLSYGIAHNEDYINEGH